MALSEKQKRYLKKRAHHLKPVVIVGGGGISEGLLAELDSTLEHHELIKVRVNAEDRNGRKALTEQLCDAVDAQLVQSIGHVAVLYRPAREPQLQLPKD